MATAYPIIANCNYESAEDKCIHEIRKAVDAGLTYDEALLDALQALEETLYEHAEGENTISMEACRDAEADVMAAWTDEVQQAVETERRSRWTD